MPNVFFDFKTGNVHTVIPDKVCMRGEQVDVDQPGRVIDNCNTASEASARYGTIRGFNTGLVR